MNLVLNGISKAYGTQVVLDHVDMSIQKGEVVGLLGRNGAGKSTLLKIIAGINPPDKGGIDRGELSIGFLSEQNPLYPYMYVREYLKWTARVKGVPNSDRRISDLISEVGLTDELSKQVYQLSKGYKQRLGLAALLLTDPQIIILDEPINGLDPVQITSYRNLIKSLSKDKIIVLSSHLMQEIEALCDRVLLLKSGRIAKDFLLNQEKETRQLHLALNKSVGIDKMLKLNSVLEVKDVGPNSYSVLVTANMASHEEIFDFVVREGCKILEMRMEKNRIEEIFE